MRTYKPDSPQAAARLIALALLADGHVSASELDALDEARLSHRLGLAPGEFRSIIRDLCEDLMVTSHLNWGNLCRPESDVMSQLMFELRDPRIQTEVIDLCKTAMLADDHVSEHEYALLHAFSRAWRMPCGWDSRCEDCEVSGPMVARTLN
jgi:uncharacterized tellurite resistance protein B-like protein